MKEYCKRPEVRRKRKAYNEGYYKDPENRRKMAEGLNRWRLNPKNKEKMRGWSRDYYHRVVKRKIAELREAPPEDLLRLVKWQMRREKNVG